MTSGFSIESISHRYGSKIALDNVTFNATAGRFCALLGPNGAGKSTLVSLLSGLFSARQGRILIDGHDMSKEPRKALAIMGIVFQSATLDTDMTVRQNMLYYAALHGLSGKKAVVASEAALVRLGMQERLGEKVKALNGGHRRRMEIARALIHNPTVLLLDEPTAGLDMAMRKSITAHVHALAKVGGLTVLWTTHLADEVEPADAVVILHQGKVVANDTCAKLTGTGTLAELFHAVTPEGEPA